MCVHIAACLSQMSIAIWKKHLFWIFLSTMIFFCPWTKTNFQTEKVMKHSNGWKLFLNPTFCLSRCEALSKSESLSFRFLKFIPQIITFICLATVGWRLACLSGAHREHKYTMSSHNMGKAWQLSEWLSLFGCPMHPSWIKCH